MSAASMGSDSVKPTESQVIVATDLTKWIGEGEARMTAVNKAGLGCFAWNNRGHSLSATLRQESRSSGR